MRAARVLAVARRDLRRVASGRARWRLAVLAVGLLTVAATARLPTASPAPPAPAAVRGAVPPALRPAVALDPAAPAQLDPGPPLTLTGERVPLALRAALDATDPAPSVIRRITLDPLHLPGRGLVVTLLVLSLLGAPLAESLPGEREERTLESLLASSLSAAEVVVGKAVAWAGAGAAAVTLAALGGALTGSWAPGVELLAAPAALAAAVAGGLWVVRDAPDVVSGATATMRLLPAVSVGLLAASAALATVHPLLGAAVPLGGALWVAGGAVGGPAALTVAIASALGLSAALLAVTARALEAVPPATAARSPVGVAALGAAAWLVLVASGGAWGVVVPGAPSPRAAVGLAAGASVLAALALWQGAQVGAPRTWDRLPRLRAIGEAAGAGALLGVGLPGLARVELTPAALDPLLHPLAGGLLPHDGPVSATLALATLGAVVAQELLFRGPALRRRPLLAAALWTLAVSPGRPLVGLASAAVLLVLARRSGVGAAMVARLAALAALAVI